MRTPRVALLCALLFGSGALAEEGEAPVVEAAPERHRLSGYLRSGLSVYLSEFRTMGGVGGGFGVRDTVEGRYLLQADATYLWALGNAVELRVGAGVQRRGTWTPAALVTASGMVGRGLRFLTATRSTPVVHPALALGVQLAPLRFTHGGAQLSLFELGVGVGSEFPGAGLSLNLTLMEAGFSF